jgi:hypothetical protein
MSTQAECIRITAEPLSQIYYEEKKMDLIQRSPLRERSFLLLAPASARLEHFSGHVKHSNKLHAEFVASMQRLRGDIYHQEGAISAASLTSDGRHVQPCDDDSWHLLSLDRQKQVRGCARFRLHSNSVGYDQLGIRDAAIAESGKWGGKLRASVNAELEVARHAGFSYVELGGWALAGELRKTSEALNFVLASYGWSQLMGGALGVSTATQRNGSAAILRRIGGKPLQWDGVTLPAYFDQRYSCEMEVLRFDSREPNPKYAGYIEEVKEHISGLSVVCKEAPSEAVQRHQFPLTADAFMPWGELAPSAA